MHGSTAIERTEGIRPEVDAAIQQSVGRCIQETNLGIGERTVVRPLHSCLHELIWCLIAGPLPSALQHNSDEDLMLSHELPNTDIIGLRRCPVLIRERSGTRMWWGMS